MLITRRVVEVTKRVFEKKMSEIQKKSEFGLFLENPREVENTLV